MGGSVEELWCAIIEGDFLSGAILLLVGASARKRRSPRLSIVLSRLGLGAVVPGTLNL